MAEETREDTQGQTEPAVVRLDESLERAGQRVGVFAALASRRFQTLVAQGAQAVGNAAYSARKAASSGAAAAGVSQAGPEEAPQAESAAPPPPVERAEELVDAAGQRLGELGQTTGQRLQMLWARVREEGEDIVAEAQTLRRPERHVH